MKAFQFTRARNSEEAMQAGMRSNTAQQGATVRFVAGGTTLVDLMKLEVERPLQVVDLNGLGLNQIEILPDGGLQIGALVTNSDLAHHAAVVRDYPVLSQALLSGASAQLRNKATTAGNLLQRTRCVYFRDISTACNKRAPGTGCSAIGGHNRMMAVLGTSESCIATNPSDMNVALVALGATIHIQRAQGKRNVRVEDFFVLPANSPERENVLEPGDLITHVTLPPPVPGNKSLYLKLRDRMSYEFALSSAAVLVNLDKGRFKGVRIALGGVGTKPWRSLEAERILTGQSANEANFRSAAEDALRSAQPQSENGFKVELAKRCLVHALKLATEMA